MGDQRKFIEVLASGEGNQFFPSMPELYQAFRRLPKEVQEDIIGDFKPQKMHPEDTKYREVSSEEWNSADADPAYVITKVYNGPDTKLRKICKDGTGIETVVKLLQSKLSGDVNVTDKSLAFLQRIFDTGDDKERIVKTLEKLAKYSAQE